MTNFEVGEQILRHRYITNFDVLFPKIANIGRFTSVILLQKSRKYLTFGCKYVLYSKFTTYRTIYYFDFGKKVENT